MSADRRCPPREGLHRIRNADRVGGLAWTVRRGSEHTETGGERQVCAFDEGQHFNAGAWRIPYTHTGILNYCKELAVPLQMFVNESDASYFFYEGSGALANRRVRLREVKADMIGRANELLVKAIDQRSLDLPLTDEDRKRFVDFLVGHGYLDASDHRYRAFEDRGPGIVYMELALRDGYTSRGGLGLGLGGARRLCNEFYIHSRPGEGTRVTVVRWR